METMLIIPAILLLVFLVGGLLYFFRRIMTKYVVSATDHLEELSQDYAKKEQEINRMLEEAKQKAQTIAASAQNEAETLKSQIIKEAESERDRVLKDAREQGNDIMQQAEKSRKGLLAELEERINREAIDKACQIIKDTIPEGFKQDIHAHWVEQLLREGFGNLSGLRIPTDINEARVVSAFPLADHVHKNLLKKMKEILGREFTIKEEIDSKIVAGVVINIGNVVLDGSLRNRILKEAKQLQRKV